MCSRPAAGCRCAQYPDDEAVDFAIVGTGAGGGTLACKLAESRLLGRCARCRPYWRPLEDFASDEHHQAKLYWTDERIVDGDNPLQLGSQQFRQIRRRLRPCISPWCRCAFAPNGSNRARKLGYGADWPLDWREMWSYYAEVEEALKISGPVNYPWGPKRPRYPYRPHELNAAALVLARGAEALGIDWSPTPLATRLGAARPRSIRASIAACA